jgi:hypothetical protein
MRKIILLLFIISFKGISISQIAGWDFFGEGTPTAGVVSSSADLWNSNLDASNLVTRGPGAAASAGSNSFRTVGFQNNGISLTNTDYFQHTLSAAPGFTLSLSSINARFAGTGSFFAAPGVSMQFAYSLDGVNFVLIGSPFIMTTTGFMPLIDLTAITDLQNVSDNITVTIRFFASGQTTTGGWGYNSPTAGTYGISFGGSLNCSTQQIYFADSDGDSFGNPTSTIQACSPPIGYVTNATDCDDANASINPNTTWYADVDGDSYGNLNAIFTGCVPPIGFVLNSSDCDDSNPSLNILTTYYQDLDQDGFGNPAVSISNCSQPLGYVINNTDCNDNSISQNSAATEIADNIDNDCDGLVDEGFAALTWYLDNDQDGFGGTDSVQSILSPGGNYILVGGDCNDVLASVNPNAQEICDGIDNNCDGLMDNGLIFSTYYADNDGDTYGNSTDSIVSCSQPVGYVSNNTDCNDAIVSINPGATDIPVNGIDEDCNGQDAPLVPLNLGMYQFAGTVDCATQDNAVTSQPSGAQFSLFNGVGTNCSAAAGVFNRSGWNTGIVVDSTEYNEFSVTADDCKKLNLDRVAFKFRPSGSAGSPVWHLRSSVDNFSTDLDFGTGANVNSAYLFDTVYLSNHLNLNQVTFRFYITEILGTTTTWRMDDVSLFGNIISVTPQTYYADFDGDGFGDLNLDTLTCNLPNGFVIDNTDCNDQNALINPSTLWYFDADNDQIGDATVSFTGCTPPNGYVLSAGDCDDSNSQISGPVTYYADLDSDGFGLDSSAQLLCQNPGAGYVTTGGDCDDLNNLINPNAQEICDGIDNDCDGLADDSLLFTMYYVDVDGDGFGDEATAVESCSQPQNTITIGGDCDDTNDQIYPGATEICDDVDNDCDGSTDEGLNFITYYTDADNDGFGTGSTGLSFCSIPGPGFSTNNQDCDDNNGQINPNAIDITGNGIDENCDGVDGILNITDLNSISTEIYPNPTSGNSTLLFSSQQKGELNLRDLNGKIVLTKSFDQKEVEILSSSLITGTYILEIKINNANFFTKLMKY